MPLARSTISRMAFAAFATIVASESSGDVLPLTSADGVAIETNRISPSNRFVGALAIWVHNSYAISIACNPPRACYAKTQLINYHFSCGPRFVVVAERISMDLNGDIVKHEVLEPATTSGLNYEADIDVLERLCGPLPDREDLLQRRSLPEPGEKPRKGR